MMIELYLTRVCVCGIPSIPIIFLMAVCVREEDYGAGYMEEVLDDIVVMSVQVWKKKEVSRKSTDQMDCPFKHYRPWHTQFLPSEGTSVSISLSQQPCASLSRLRPPRGAPF